MSKYAYFGAGCFWGVEHSFAKKFPQFSRKVGYMGGKESPAGVTYQQVCSGKTGHAEVLQVEYKTIADFEALTDFFYRMHDPTTLNRQGNDAGTQYRSVIFYANDEELKAATKVTDFAKTHYKSVATTLEKTGVFYPAEAYHQNYLENNPHGYQCATHFERSWEQIKKQFA